MNNYVLAFAQQIPFVIQQHIVVIEKQHPEWQKGKINLPGGKVHSGEVVAMAACRELQEETTIVAKPHDAQHMGAIVGFGWQVDVVKCLYHAYHGGRQQEAQTATDEAVGVANFRTVLEDPRLLPPLKLVIPLCMAGVSGWRITPAGVSEDMDDYGPENPEQSWVVTL